MAGKKSKKKQTAEIDEPARMDVLLFAQRQRYALLLTKIQANQALTKTELDELGDYEKATKAEKNGNGKAHDIFIKKQVDAARFAGVDVRTILRWRNNGMPVTPEGWYIRPVLEYFRDNKGRQVSKARQRQDETEADRKDVRLERERIELAQLKKENDGVWERANILKIVAMKRAMLGHPRKMAPILEGKRAREIEKLLEVEVRFIISIFSGYKTGTTDSTDDTEKSINMIL